MLTETVDTYHGRVIVLVLNKRGNGSHADAQGTDENEGVELLPVAPYGIATDNLGFGVFLLQAGGNRFTSLIDLYDSYFVHFSRCSKSCLQWPGMMI